MNSDLKTTSEEEQYTLTASNSPCTINQSNDGYINYKGECVKNIQNVDSFCNNVKSITCDPARLSGTITYDGFTYKKTNYKALPYTTSSLVVYKDSENDSQNKQEVVGILFFGKCSELNTSTHTNTIGYINNNVTGLINTNFNKIDIKINANRCDACFYTNPNIDLSKLAYTRVSINNDNKYNFVSEKLDYRSNSDNTIPTVTNSCFYNNTDDSIQTDTNSSLTKNVAIGIGAAGIAGIGIGALIAWFFKSTPKHPNHNNDGGNGPYDPPPPPPGGGDGPGGQSGSYNNFPTYYQPKHDNNPVKVSHLLSAGAGALFGVAGTGLAFILKSRGGSNSASSECSIDKHEQIKGLHKAFGMKGGFGMKYQGTINQDTLDGPTNEPSHSQENPYQDTLDSLTKGLPYSQEAEKCWENPVYDDLCNNVQTLGAYPICNIIQHHHC